MIAALFFLAIIINASFNSLYPPPPSALLYSWLPNLGVTFLISSMYFPDTPLRKGLSVGYEVSF